MRYLLYLLLFLCTGCTKDDDLLARKEGIVPQESFKNVTGDTGVIPIQYKEDTTRKL